jgi:hypothetical protein
MTAGERTQLYKSLATLAATTSAQPTAQTPRGRSFAELSRAMRRG